jgi:hypothetical protein
MMAVTEGANPSRRSTLWHLVGRLLKRLGIVLETIMVREKGWGYLRLALVTGLVMALVAWYRSEWAEGGVGAEAFLDGGWRYWILPMAALACGFWITSRYVARLYQMPRSIKAFQYLFASAFGIGYEHRSISDGKIDLHPGEFNLVNQADGPMYVSIQPGNAILLESLCKPTQVYGAGRHFISRFERVREIFSLADQHGVAEQFSATTRDGIAVMVRNLQYRYRLRTGHRPRDYQRRTPSDPYPFSSSAVRDLAYERNVRADGLEPWDFAVKTAIEDVLTDYINQHPFEAVVTPRTPVPQKNGGNQGEPDIEKPDPRKDMTHEIQAKASRERLRGFGTELLWFDIGQLEAARPEVADQLVNMWEKLLEDRAEVTPEYWQAQQTVQLEQGRAQAQADILKDILKTCEVLGQAEDIRQYLADLIVARTAEVLWPMASPEQQLCLRKWLPPA